MNKILALCASAILSTSAVAADNQSYFGGSFHLGNYEPDGGPDFNPSALKLEYGNYISQNVAIEGHFLLGISDDSATYEDITYDFEISNAISIFIKGDINLDSNTNLYGLLGFTKAKAKIEVSEYDYSDSEDESGLSYGFGIESEVSNGISLSGEYLIYLSEDDFDYTGFNFGISKKF